MPQEPILARDGLSDAPTATSMGQIVTVPSMGLVVAPPTQMVPRLSAVISMVPARPSRLPCATRKVEGAAPVEMSHCATEALMLPQTGSSGTPTAGAKVRISKDVVQPVWVSANRADHRRGDE